MGLSKTDVVVGPAAPVSIVGFPYGLAQQGGLPVWKIGTVASDLDIDIGGKPIFLVDTTARPGMSGSPVYAVRSGAFRSSDGSLHTAIGGSSIKKFLGVYSEQIQAAETRRGLEGKGCDDPLRFFAINQSLRQFFPLELQNSSRGTRLRVMFAVGCAGPNPQTLHTGRTYCKNEETPARR